MEERLKHNDKKDRAKCHKMPYKRKQQQNNDNDLQEKETQSAAEGNAMTCIRSCENYIAP
jgi:hypothetical protein